MNTEIKKDRRHWYDHEKLEIIQKYESGALEKVPTDPYFVIDPKSKKEQKDIETLKSLVLRLSLENENLKRLLNRTAKRIKDSRDLETALYP